MNELKCPTCGSDKFAIDYMGAITLSVNNGAIVHVNIGGVTEGEVHQIHCAECEDIPGRDLPSKLYVKLGAALKALPEHVESTLAGGGTYWEKTQDFCDGCGSYAKAIDSYGGEAFWCRGNDECRRKAMANR